MSIPPIVLASTSPYRRQLLERLRIPFEVARPSFDERAPLPPEVRGVEATATYLARMKALSVGRPDAWVIGSDQICALGDRVLHKPGSVENAQQQLWELQGRAHRLVTAIAVVAPHGTIEARDVHTLHMRRLDRATIAAYVAADSPLDCAGSYRIEGRGIALFERIEADPESADDTAIVGLPLWLTVRALRDLGFDVLTESGT